MAVRIAIVGPGRVGRTFARAFAAAGVEVVGFVARTEAAAAAAVGELGQGRALTFADLDAVHVAVFAVGDNVLAEVVRAAAAAGGRCCSLWMHTSGRHGLDVFEPARARQVRVGALHPLLPFATSPTGTDVAGAPALLTGEAKAMRLLRRLAGLLGMQPIVCGEQDRVLYHAGCALAANGAMALFELAERVLAAAGGLCGADGRRVVGALIGAAVASAARHGPAKALSGPVRRGDAATVQAHLQRLGRAAPSALPSYRALMAAALELARCEGLPRVDCERLADTLSLTPPRDGT
ncbi:MAG TPA: DUF2520 domain-containing protein [bacterium]|nr:DUF2520 domain-containing protein [bacterium]